MWEIHNNLQIFGFLYSCVLGIIFCVFYDVIRTIRIIKKHNNLTVFFEDIIFFLTVSVTTFIFLLSITNGEIRAYILFGIIIGFTLFNRIFSKCLIKYTKVIFKLIFKGISYISKCFYWFFGKIDMFISIISENSLKIFKKGLKITNSLLYTNKNNATDFEG